MSGWVGLLVAAAACLLVKLAGYLVPHAVLERPRVARVAALLPVALLSALVAVQTLGSGHHLRLDARLAAVVVAALLLWRRAPFIVVVVVAALTAALLRKAGWG